MMFILVLALFPMICAGAGFQQAFHWDAPTMVFAMAVMVPGAAIVTNLLLHPSTRARLDSDLRFQMYFFAAVSAFALIVFSNGAAGFTGAKHLGFRYAAIWWFCFPYACGVLLFLDRICNAFKGVPSVFKKQQSDKRTSGDNPFGDAQRGPDLNNTTESNVIHFDPNRFRR